MITSGPQSSCHVLPSSSQVGRQYVLRKIPYVFKSRLKRGEAFAKNWGLSTRSKKT